LIFGLEEVLKILKKYQYYKEYQVIIQTVQTMIREVIESLLFKRLFLYFSTSTKTNLNEFNKFPLLLSNYLKSLTSINSTSLIWTSKEALRNSSQSNYSFLHFSPQIYLSNLLSNLEASTLSLLTLLSFSHTKTNNKCM
jgi:hypothetical protein